MSRKNKLNTQDEQVVLVGSEKELSTDIAKCPSCGSNLVFFPETQTLKCEHCGTEKTFEAHRNYEQNFSQLFEHTNTWTDETHVFECNNCGAKQALSKSEIATSCAFCGTSNIVERDELAGLKPDSVVPFKISKDTAINGVVHWVKKKFFVPSKFKKNIDPQDVSGIYNPAFTFDTNTSSFYHGRLGRYKIVTKMVKGKMVTERRTEYFNIRGDLSMAFDDVLIQASTIIKQKDINALQPFNTGNSNAYAKEFLHGYSATQYSKDGRQCWSEAKKVIDNHIRNAILSKYHFDFVDFLNVSTNCNDITYKYMLLPIYVGHLGWKKKIYNFFVNGFNGKVTGKMPVSAGKVLLVVGLALVFVAAVALVGYFVLNNPPN